MKRCEALGITYTLRRSRVHGHPRGRDLGDTKCGSVGGFGLVYGMMLVQGCRQQESEFDRCDAGSHGAGSSTQGTGK